MLVESRWFRRAGPGIVAVAALALVTTATLAAWDRPWDPTVCPGQPGRGPAGGSWYELAPRIAHGERNGQTLRIGVARHPAPRWIELDAESFASGPFGG